VLDERGWRATFFTTGMEHSPTLPRWYGHRRGDVRAGQASRPLHVSQRSHGHTGHVPLTREGAAKLRPQWLSALAILACASTVFCAADWSSCHDDLDRLRSASSDASDAAEEVEQAAQDVESKKDDVESALSSLRRCTRNCQYERSLYNSARSEYESAKDDERSVLPSSVSSPSRIGNSHGQHLPAVSDRSRS
jgi:hypothetical protein